MSRRGRLAVTTVLVLALASCGGESEDTSVARALATDLRSDDAFADDITADEARCVGDDLVATLGVDDARSVGRTEAADGSDADAEEPFELNTLDDDEVDAIGAAMEQCVDGLETIVADLVADGILDSPDDDFPVDDDEAQCVGVAVADDIGFSRLLTLGLAGGDLDGLTEDEAETFGASFSDCVDVRSILLDQVADSGAEPDVVACLDDQISDDAIEMLFVDTFAGDTASAEGAFAEAIDACA
ncbi:MAG: hypothetical protein OSA99_12005 [Acidimicrobiales bacterium]|nr:hypothetical protein [Acidimicrobiales bacterium]